MMFTEMQINLIEDCVFNAISNANLFLVDRQKDYDSFAFEFRAKVEILNLMVRDQNYSYWVGFDGDLFTFGYTVFYDDGSEIDYILIGRGKDRY